jgi:hypothetical protein
VTYNLNDVLAYNGSAWIATQTTTNQQGVPSTNAAWALLASKGDSHDLRATDLRRAAIESKKIS